MNILFYEGRFIVKDSLDALGVALNNELRERKFYLKNAERTINPVGKAMFKQLAHEELEHYGRLKQLHRTWKKDEKWPETVPLVVNETRVKDVLKDMIKKASQMPTKKDDDLTAVRTAIDFEAKGVQFYTQLRDNVSDKKEKAFFGLLADIEREHFASLKDTETFMIDPASWFREKESTGLDGA
jgi:rubrerythrin